MTVTHKDKIKLERGYQPLTLEDLNELVEALQKAVKGTTLLAFRKPASDRQNEYPSTRILFKRT